MRGGGKFSRKKWCAFSEASNKRSDRGIETHIFSPSEKEETPTCISLNISLKDSSLINQKLLIKVFIPLPCFCHFFFVLLPNLERQTSFFQMTNWQDNWDLKLELYVPRFWICQDHFGRVFFALKKTSGGSLYVEMYKMESSWFIISQLQARLFEKKKGHTLDRVHSSPDIVSFCCGFVLFRFVFSRKSKKKRLAQLGSGIRESEWSMEPRIVWSTVDFQRFVLCII